MISLSFPDSRTRIGTLILDVLLTEEITLDGEVTLYPVEDGTTISDHILQGPERLRISGLVSTADVDLFGIRSGTGNKLLDTLEAMRRLHAERALVTISTGRTLYKDFAFTNLSATRSADGRGGDWLDIKAELVKVRKVQLRTAEVPAERAQGPAAGRAGQTNTPAGRSSPSSTASTPPAAGTGENRSLLYNLDEAGAGAGLRGARDRLLDAARGLMGGSQ